MNGTARASKGIITPLDAQPVEEGMAPRTRCIVEERSVDEVRPLRIVIIGAGISGILACIRLMQRIPNLQLCIYDKNPDIGGTWFENRYPGCACGMYPPPITIWILSHWQRWHTDIPAHTYQASFEPNKEWSTFYAKSPEIHKYWTRVVEKYGCRKYMKLKHRVANAIWDESISKWKLQVSGFLPGQE
jgi:cation diffusion facilitator CzcD-associated flavoprotein CzcO